MSRIEDLEQELEITTAELEQAQRELRAMRGELTGLRATASAAGVALAPIATPIEAERAELVQVRMDLENDLQAINELRNPPARNDAPVESSLDVVRANQREREELQDRLRAANLIVSRVAALLGVDQWDAEGTEVRAAAQRVADLHLKIRREIKQWKGPLSDSEQASRMVEALTWVLDEMRVTTRPPAGIASTPPRWRKLPVVVDAWRWDGNTHALARWAAVVDLEHRKAEGRAPIEKGGTLALPIGIDPTTGLIEIETLEGTITGSLGDWIICGVKGEFYPCKPEIFDATYEPAD